MTSTSRSKQRLLSYLKENLVPVSSLYLYWHRVVEMAEDATRRKKDIRWRSHNAIDSLSNFLLIYMIE